MDIEQILRSVQDGSLDVKDALGRLAHWPVSELEYAKLDTQRAARKGFPETVLCAGKAPEHLAGIVQRMGEAGQPVLATRADQAAFDAIRSVAPDARYVVEARIVVVGPPAPTIAAPPIIVLTAGTSDIPVAEEAVATCEFLGSPVERIYDAGVAGLSRLLAQLDRLRAASVVIAVAGMDGALPGVTAGLVACPVLAVPTSTGYGAAFGGLAALGTMLNSCAPGLSVLNIDNGYGAACQAHLIQKIHAKVA